MTSEYWNEESKTYVTKQWRNSIIARFDYLCTKEALLRYLAPTKKDIILEIGCGSGIWTKTIGNRCKKIIAIDISEKMIEKSRECIRLKNSKFLVSDFLSFSTVEKFDKIFAVRSFEYLASARRAIEKIYKMLVDGGKVVLITKSKPCAWDFIYYERWKRKDFRQNKLSWMKIRELLHKVGFKDIMLFPVIIRLPIFSGGNDEFPLIPNFLAKYILECFKIFRLFYPSILFAESYGVCATK